MLLFCQFSSFWFYFACFKLFTIKRLHLVRFGESGAILMKMSFGFAVAVNFLASRAWERGGDKSNGVVF